MKYDYCYGEEGDTTRTFHGSAVIPADSVKSYLKFNPLSEGKVFSRVSGFHGDDSTTYRNAFIVPSSELEDFEHFTTHKTDPPPTMHMRQESEEIQQPDELVTVHTPKFRTLEQARRKPPPVRADNNMLITPRVTEKLRIEKDGFRYFVPANFPGQFQPIEEKKMIKPKQYNGANNPFIPSDNPDDDIIEEPKSRFEPDDDELEDCNHHRSPFIQDDD